MCIKPIMEMLGDRRDTAHFIVAAGSFGIWWTCKFLDKLQAGVWGLYFPIASNFYFNRVVFSSNSSIRALDTYAKMQLKTFVDFQWIRALWVARAHWRADAQAEISAISLLEYFKHSWLYLLNHHIKPIACQRCDNCKQRDFKVHLSFFIQGFALWS